MSAASSDTPSRLRRLWRMPQNEWGIWASLATYFLALTAPVYLLGAPLAFSVLQWLPVDTNIKTSLFLAVLTAGEFGVVWLVLMAYGKTLRDIGFTKVRWLHTAKAALGYVVYIAIFMVLFQLAVKLLHVDQNQPQNIGYGQLQSWFELALAFVQLVILTPVAEETLFRGFIFEGFRRKMPFWAAAIVVSLLFGLAHGQWNVGIDVFVLSMVSCYLREKNNSLWPSIFLHVIKNLVAFWALYLYNGG